MNELLKSQLEQLSATYSQVIQEIRIENAKVLALSKKFTSYSPVVPLNDSSLGLISKMKSKVPELEIKKLTPSQIRTIVQNFWEIHTENFQVVTKLTSKWKQLVRKSVFSSWSPDRILGFREKFEFLSEALLENGSFKNVDSMKMKQVLQYLLDQNFPEEFCRIFQLTHDENKFELVRHELCKRKQGYLVRWSDAAVLESRVSKDGNDPLSLIAEYEELFAKYSQSGSLPIPNGNLVEVFPYFRLLLQIWARTKNSELRSLAWTRINSWIVPEQLGDPRFYRGRANWQLL